MLTPQTPAPLDATLLTAVSEAIAKADKHRRFGSYNYSSYPGDAPPFVIRNEDTGAELYRGNDEDYCHKLYDRLTKEWVAECAIKAMETWLAKDIGERFAKFNENALWGRVSMSDQLSRRGS